MAILTQGTQVYFIDPDINSVDNVIVVECATTLSPGGNPADQIEVTCLEDFERAYLPGLRTPGQATMGINTDSQYDSHVRMFELSQDNPPPVLKWALGWSDGTEAPTSDSVGDFDLPDTRTWYLFDGYISDFPLDFAQNSVVQTTVTIQRSGGSQWIPKVLSI